MNEVAQLAVIEDFKLNRDDLLERIASLEDEITQREQINLAQLEQQEREQIEGKNKYQHHSVASQLCSPDVDSYTYICQLIRCL